MWFRHSKHHFSVQCVFTKGLETWADSSVGTMSFPFDWTTFISPKYKAQKKDWRQEWLYIIENSTGYSYQKENLAIVLHPSGMRYTVWLVNKKQNKTARTKSNQIKSNSVNKLSTQHSSALEMGSPMGSPLLLQPMSFPQHFPMRKFSQSSSPFGLCKRKKNIVNFWHFPKCFKMNKYCPF